MTKMNDPDLCLKVVLRSCQPLRYIWRWISRKPLEIEAWFQRTKNRKLHMSYRMVTWPMTSRDPERSNSWPQYAWSAISRKRLEIETISKGPPIGNDIWSIKWSRDRWRHVTPKVLWDSTVGYPGDSLASCFPCYYDLWSRYRYFNIMDAFWPFCSIYGISDLAGFFSSNSKVIVFALIENAYMTSF